MKSLWFCLLFAIAGISVAKLPPPERSYKILMLLPASSKSHRNVFMPVAEGLAERGHKIVMLTNNNKPSNNPNIEEINHGLPHFNTDDLNMFETRKSPGNIFKLFTTMIPQMARDIYKLPKVKELYEKRMEFDLIIIDHLFNEFIYPFAHEMPFITIATPGYDPRQSTVLGNPPNPAYVPNLYGGVDLSTVYGRFLNAFLHIAPAFRWRVWEIVPLMQKEITEQFPTLPPLLDIERNQSLTLLNTHFTLDMPMPLLPSQIEVGGMHCRPAEPLPEDLNSWIEGAGPAGVVYFSLGSVARGDTMPVVYRNMFLEAFRKMEQRVIWKFEGDLDNVPKNVLIRKWLPQQDILAHPNVKVFITHSGGLSTQEAIYHATPVLCVPIFGDQPKNGENMAHKELGLFLVWEKLTTDMITNSLLEIINNPKYQKNMYAVSKSFRDQIDTPKDRAIFWTEYVIRHNGAPILRCPAANLSWIEFLMLDVVAALLSVLVIAFLFIRWIFQKILCLIFGGGGKKKKRE